MLIPYLPIWPRVFPHSSHCLIPLPKTLTLGLLCLRYRSIIAGFDLSCLNIFLYDETVISAHTHIKFLFHKLNRFCPRNCMLALNMRLSGLAPLNPETRPLKRNTHLKPHNPNRRVILNTRYVHILMKPKGNVAKIIKLPFRQLVFPRTKQTDKQLTCLLPPDSKLTTQSKPGTDIPGRNALGSKSLNRRPASNIFNQLAALLKLFSACTRTNVKGKLLYFNCSHRVTHFNR